MWKIHKLKLDLRAGIPGTEHLIKLNKTKGVPTSGNQKTETVSEKGLDHKGRRFHVCAFSK